MAGRLLARLEGQLRARPFSSLAIVALVFLANWSWGIEAVAASASGPGTRDSGLGTLRDENEVDERHGDAGE